MSAPAVLHRHQLAWLQDRGWREVMARYKADAPVLACLSHWRAHRLPLIVTRQPDPGSAAAAAAPAGVAASADCAVAALPECLHMGLPLPRQWGRGRLSVPVSPAAVRAWGECPEAETVEALLPSGYRQPWRRLCVRWHHAGCTARVYGGYGWQRLSGLAYLRPGSDLDLLLTVRDAGHADRMVALLEGFIDTAAPDAALPGIAMPAIDGELLFPDHRAVSWREWRQWRHGRTRSILVKRIDGVRLHARPWWAETPAPPAAMLEDGASHAAA